MSSLRASGMMHRGPRFEFARLGPGSAVGKKAAKLGQNIAARSEPSGGLGYLSSRFARRFLSFFPEAEPGPRLQFSGSDFAPPTSPSGGWHRIHPLSGLPIVLAFAGCSHNSVSRDRKIGMQCVYLTNRPQFSMVNTLRKDVIKCSKLKWKHKP